MPVFQVTCRELVYVDRTYELEAPSAVVARKEVQTSEGAAGECVSEQTQDTYEFCFVAAVYDENGNQVT